MPHPDHQTRLQLALKLVDPSRPIARFSHVDHKGVRSYDRVIMYREAWEMTDPPRRFGGIVSDGGNVVEVIAPPGWEPAPYPDEGTCRSFDGAVVFPAPPRSTSPVGR
jgi:hypothetical protein